MTSARAFLRSLLRTYDDAGTVLEHLNDYLVADIRTDHFMTLFLGILTLQTGELVYSSAGHDRPLLLRAGSEDCEELDSTSLPLGMVEGMDYPVAAVSPLKPGDVLMLTTDGLWEAPDAEGQAFSRERMAQSLVQSRTQAAASIITTLADRVDLFRGAAHQEDDLTASVIKRTADD
jgi:sigma-B regulation protein RsbU (phosphoserine phosphatase)